MCWFKLLRCFCFLFFLTKLTLFCVDSGYRIIALFSLVWGNSDVTVHSVQFLIYEKHFWQNLHIFWFLFGVSSGVLNQGRIIFMQLACCVCGGKFASLNVLESKCSNFIPKMNYMPKDFNTKLKSVFRPLFWNGSSNFQ